MIIINKRSNHNNKNSQQFNNYYIGAQTYYVVAISDSYLTKIDPRMR